MTEAHSYCDVLIAGGGLAGLTAAVLLARRGWRVLVLEKENYPRHKVCGEYISNESRDFLLRLGLPLDRWQLPQISRLQVSSPGGSSVHASLGLGGFGISRYRLDAALMELAQQAGVQVQTGCRADSWEREGDGYLVSAGEQAFRCRVLLGAWGKRSNLDVKVQRPFATSAARGLDNYIGIKYHIRCPWPEDLIALHNFEGGYCGISRVEDDTCCLCYLTTAAQLRKAGGNIRAMEEQVLHRNPHLAEIWNRAHFLYEEPLAIAQISFRSKEQVLDGVLMLGDTAGLITPLCGNGMSMAFHSAQLAVDCVALFLEGRADRAAMEQQYVLGWKRRFNRRLQAGRFIQRFFGDGRLTGMLLQFLKWMPFLKQPLIRLTHGQVF